MMYWLPLEAQTRATSSWPQPENEHLLSVTCLCSYMLGNLRVMLWEIFIYVVMVAIAGKAGHDIFVTPP